MESTLCTPHSSSERSLVSLLIKRMLLEARRLIQNSPAGPGCRGQRAVWPTSRFWGSRGVCSGASGACVQPKPPKCGCGRCVGPRQPRPQPHGGLLLRPVTRPAASAPQPVGPDEPWPLPEERAFSVKWQGTPQDRPRAASEMPGRCVTGDSPVTHTPHLPSPGRTKGPDFRLTCFCLHQSEAGTFVRPVSLKAMGTCWHLSAHDQLSATR